MLMAVLVVLLASGMTPQKTAAAEGRDGFRAVYTPSALAAGLSPGLRERGLSAFSASLPAAAAHQPVGLFVPGGPAFPIISQPAANPAYVSPADGVLTQFGLAAGYGSTGLLAHNTAAGAQFSQLSMNQLIYLVHGDKHIQPYVITAIQRYRALQPASPYSDFIDLDQPGKRLTAENLFYQVYAVEGRLILQTCIAAEGLENWGRLFLIAEPVEPEPITRKFDRHPEKLALSH
jgi:hypothetical protein